MTDELTNLTDDGGDDKPELPVQPEELSVVNTFSYWDMLYCTSMPHHPLVRMAISSASVLLGMLIAMAMFGVFFLDPLILLPALAFSFIFPINAYWVLRKNRDRFTDQNIVVTAAGIYSETKTQSRALVAWSKVIAIKRQHRAITIQISKAPAMYFWLARTSFPSEEAYEQYYQRTLEFWHAAQTDVRGQLKLYDASSPAAEKSLSEHQRVSADLTLPELMIGNWHRRWKLLGLAAVSALTLAVTASMTAGVPESFAFFFYGLAVLMLALVPLQSWVSYKRHPDWMRGEIAISPEEMVSSGAGYDGVLPWSSIAAVERKHGIIFLRLKTNWSIYIPVRCFASAVDADIFYDDAKRYCEVAKRALPKA